MQPAASYESASIRMFQLGRTDTIRSCSIESLEFTKAMLDDNTTNTTKAEFLRKAVQSHKNYTNDVSYILLCFSYQKKKTFIYEHGFCVQLFFVTS